MLLEIKYNEKALRPIAAAVIPGGEPALWLEAIGRWGIAPNTLRCFMMPESIRSTVASGLFVIFPDAQGTSLLQLRYLYGEVTGGFFIPVNASLFPEVLPEELNTLKLWEVQVFHPAIGLVGFDATDEIKLEDLVDLPEEKDSGWLTEFPEARPFPRLMSISLEPEEQLLDAMDALGALIDKYELSDIPQDETDRKTLFQKIIKVVGVIGLWLLLVLAFIGKVILAILSAIFRMGSRPTYQSPKPGWLQQLEEWVTNRLKNIEKQRDSELNRLVKLFDKNNDEALRYAIPLNSPYLNRGTAPKSGKLSRRSLNLNLRGFGSGRAADAWDLGEYRETLRQRYVRSANANIEKGDYKKAAYIYAHLLGDLPMAAKVLQDGKHFREAAAIYKDHLHNRTKAAECLENGGLLGDAIPIYVDLGSYEKAGDLHTQLGQDEQARKYYQDTVDRSLVSKDYLNASRLKIEKLHEKEKGRKILLDGWKDDNQSELCLKQYFETTEELNQEIKNVYSNHLGMRKKTAFLNVLSDLPEIRRDEHLQETALNIAYEIVHQQAARGDHSGMRLLTKFLPEDRLLGQDSNRYILQNHRKPVTIFESSYIELRQDIGWYFIENYHDQLIGIGIKKQEVFLLRANWQGKIAYEFLFLLADDARTLRLIADGYVSPAMLLSGNAVSLQTEKKLEAYSYFERELDFFQLNWTPPQALAFGVKSEPGEIFMLYVNGDHLCLDKFNTKGDVLKGNYCLLNGGQVSIYNMPNLHVSGMYWRKSHFYLTGRDCLIRLDENGNMQLLPLGAEVLDFSISSPHSALKVAVITDKGCMVITPGIKEIPPGAYFFAADMGGCFVKLLPDNKLILASSEMAWGYDISGPEPKLICEIEPGSRIYKILTVPKRHHFALLEEDNRVTVHQLPGD